MVGFLVTFGVNFVAAFAILLVLAWMFWAVHWVTETFGFFGWFWLSGDVINAGCEAIGAIVTVAGQVVAALLSDNS